MKDSRPLLVISDLHLGRPGMVARAGELQPLVDSASTLIVNGDTAELHLPHCKEQAAAQLEDLRIRCRAADTRLVLLAGNHDPDLVPWRILELAAGQVIITHGDGLDDALAPWSEAASIIRDRFRSVRSSQDATRRETLEGLFEACRLAARAEFETELGMRPPTTPTKLLTRPRRLAAILKFWSVHATRMDRFVRRYRPEARISIVGHSHRAGIVRRGRRTIINTGCFGTPGPALTARLMDDRLTVHRVRRRRGEWRIDDRHIHLERDVPISADQSMLESHAWPGFAA